MSAPEIGLVVLFIVFSGAVLGMQIGRFLPPHHVSSETKTVVSVSTAVVGTVSALVLGLLISSASSSFSTRNAEVTRLSADIIRIDRLLRQYGPEADLARDALQRYTAMKLDDMFPEGADRKPHVDNPATLKMLEHVQDVILALKPGDDRQHWLITQALQLAAEIGETRWLLVQQSTGSVPIPFLILVVFWLTILFASFGLFAPRNVTVTVALFLCSLAVSGGIEMILDMDNPFKGVLRISSAPMRHAVEVISH
ncbi:MAG: hypothetical protein QOK29_5060 [Rhodospirillaceae bacterium]|nr:hypothetical protein [Rhodospirillaceae bacterium]